MRVANLDSRVSIVADDKATDVESASDGRFGPDPGDVLDDWDGFVGWAETADLSGARPFDPNRLGPPVPSPRQVFAIGLNYAEHARESGFGTPAEPPVFTKFPSCLTGPYGEITLPGDGNVDWEIELVVVVGRQAYRVGAADALDHVAGYTAGQDLSERKLQMAAVPPQFSLGKSLPGFGPIGPWLVTLDEFDDPDDLALACAVDGEQVQSSRTSDMIFPVSELIARLSAATVLLPGDLIFTGTPSGVGMGRSPARFLGAGSELVSMIEGIGEMRHRFVPAEEA